MAKKKRKKKEAAPGHFSPELFTFLRSLERNNDRAWFEKNKPRYEQQVKQPFLDFIADFAPRLAKIAPHLVADARSMFRIYRDTRFSKDKTPYKTHASAHFQHRISRGAAREESVHAPGFYLHLEPGEVFLAGGLWRPPTDIANRIRRAIDANRSAWKAATKKLELGGDTLARPPRGFDPGHPLLADLKRKDFIASIELDEEAACAPEFLDDVEDACKRIGPLLAFLCKATGVPY